MDTMLPFRADERPPSPPPKDRHLRPLSTSTRRNSIGEQSTLSDRDSMHLNPGELTRAGSLYSVGSIFSISRTSFSSQILQLISIQLPHASSFSASLSAQITSLSATRALSDAADQIELWIRKANDIFNGFDAGDDAEWAAAAGRDGLGEVDCAIDRFESVIAAYITIVEDLQARKGASLVPAEDMHRLVNQLEKIAAGWQGIEYTLKDVKCQVELAMEFEELMNIVIGEIRVELQTLSRMVFEMEEQRYKPCSSDVNVSHSDANVGFDVTNLERIMADALGTTTHFTRPRNSFSLSAGIPISSLFLSSGSRSINQQNSSLLSLLAKMQPLRASLDFLPIRLSTFHGRASANFPTACNELESTCATLEQQWQRLESDAVSLRRELEEDQWNQAFKNAGHSALRLIDCVASSITELDEALTSNFHLKHAPGTTKKIESYQANKLHYCPAIERVLAILGRGAMDRSTVNGEIVRLQADVRQRWQTLGINVKKMDSTLEDYPTQQLRDSVSSTFSSDHSFTSSVLARSTVITPGSSPPSSILGSSRNDSAYEAVTSKTSQSKHSGSTQSELRGDSPHDNLVSRNSQSNRFGALEANLHTTPSSNSRWLPVTPTPPDAQKLRLPAASINRPRWNTSTVVPDSAISPPPWRKSSTPMPTTSRPLGIPAAAISKGSLLNLETTPSNLHSTPPVTNRATSRLSSSPPTSTPPPPQHLGPPSSAMPPSKPPLSIAALRNTRRSSLIPQPKARASPRVQHVRLMGSCAQPRY